MSSPVHRLFFGRDDAESDFTSGLLREGFQPTHAYEAARTGRKSLVVGRKGSGKSAICAHLAAGGGYAGQTAAITPDAAAGDEIRRFDLQGLTPDAAKSLIWRYVFAVQTARYITAHARQVHGGLRAPGSTRDLKDFLAANGESDEGRLSDRLRRGSRRLQSATLSLKMLGVEASVEALGGPEEAGNEGARALRQLEALERGVRTALADLGCAHTHPPLLILVDKLEDVWHADPDSHALVTGLLLAAKHVTGSCLNAVRCVLFLRSDIYDRLNFADGDKFRSEEIRITWTPEALRELALIRARISLGEPLTEEDLWGRIFPATVHGEPTPTYLSRRSLPRPRDAILFLTLCRDAAAKRDHATVREEDVIAATEEFSHRKLEDLAKEYNVGFPFLRAVFALFENGGYVVPRPEFTQRFDEIRDALHEAHSDYTELLTAQTAVDVLYSIGFLGVRRGNGVAYASDSAFPAQPYENELHVHPCFRPALNCRSSAGDPHAELPRPVSDVIVGGHGAFALRSGGADVALAPDRDVQLLDDLVRSCERLLALLDRSALRAALRDEMTETLRALTHNARSVRRVSGPAQPMSAKVQVGSAVHLLRALSDRLTGEGYAEEPVTLRLTDEARVLGRRVGGAVGGGGGSDSSG
ncbi:P-loop ATPase, Sll1717 family [Streptomyces sp. NPDC057877]|uniref:P-loop ATPase, Sll1717 family n=1 Tax=Streptomyces sp. NPDC057877 TaxID=3346269 RepID=UPI0036A861AB